MLITVIDLTHSELSISMKHLFNNIPLFKGSSFNNRQPIQSDLESSYLLNNYNQQQNQHLSYSPETKYTQNYFEHNDQYKLSYQNYYGFSNSSSSISNRPEPTNYFSSYQSQENILQPARFNTYPSNRQDSSVLTSTGNYYNNNLSPVMPVKTSKIVSEEKLSKNSTGTKQIENPKANKNVKVKMQDMDIWSEFNQVGTEMIVTKSGRRMFPALRVSVSGLNSSAKYNMIIDVVPADDDRYKYQSGKWIVNGRADVHFSGRGYLHPDGPLTGNQWMKHIVSFHKLKITNNAFDRAGHIILNSMQKYVPRIHLIETEGKSVNTFVLSEATFMAVTAYQNEMVS